MVKGKVQAVRKDKTGLLVDDKWYSNKAEYLDDDVIDKLGNLSNGDFVSIETNKKGYLEDVEVLDKGKSESKSDESDDSVDKSYKLSYAKDLAVAVIDKADEVNQVEVGTILSDCVKAVNKAEKLVE